jgi:hypothetical protein
MRHGLGFILLAALLGAGAILSGNWLAQSEAGLRQLMSGTIAVGPSDGLGLGARASSAANWRAPGDLPATEAVAMSEQDWLRLGDTVAPVSYYDEPPADAPPPQSAEQQPL